MWCALSSTLVRNPKQNFNSDKLKSRGGTVWTCFNTWHQNLQYLQIREDFSAHACENVPSKLCTGISHQITIKLRYRAGKGRPRLLLSGSIILDWLENPVFIHVPRILVNISYPINVCTIVSVNPCITQLSSVLLQFVTILCLLVSPNIPPHIQP